MGIRQSIANLILPKEYKLGNPVSGGALQYFNMQMPPGWGYQTYLKAYGEIGVLFSVVNVIAQGVSKVDWHLYEVDSQGGQTELTTHPMLDLFNKPNYFQSRYQFIYLGTLYKLLVGEQFWQMNFNGKGQPAEMWQAPPAFMAVIPSATNYIDHYEYKRNNATKSFTLDEIVHIYTPNPFNEFRGLSPAQALTTDLDSERFASQYQQKLFFNEAMPGFIISYPADNMPPAEQRKELQQEWDERFKGFRNRGKTAFLYGGTPNTVTMTNRDMDFQKLRTYTRDAICAAYHCPPSVLGITEMVNRSNAETSQYQLAQYCIHPELSEIREAINKEITPFFGDYLRMDFENPIPEDATMKAANSVQLYKSGIITLNEARDMNALEPDITPAGDEYYTAPAPLSFGSPDGKPAGGSPDEMMNPTDAGAGGTKELKKKTINPEAYWKTYVSHAESYEAPAISALQSMFNKQKTSSLLALEQGKQVIFDKQESIKEYKQVMTPVLTQVMHGAINNGRDLLKPPTPHKGDPLNPIPSVVSMGALNWLKTRIAWAAEQIGEESAKQLAQILTDDYSAGKSTFQISQDIQAEFDQFSSVRADMIARTEIMSASAQGALEGYKESGVVSKVKFYTAEDERTCDYCNNYHDEVFDIGQEIPIPLHPNCRCVFLPVID